LESTSYGQAFFGVADGGKKEGAGDEGICDCLILGVTAEVELHYKHQEQSQNDKQRRGGKKPYFLILFCW